MRFWISVLDVRNVSVVPLVALLLEFMQDAFMTHYNVGIAVCARGWGHRPSARYSIRPQLEPGHARRAVFGANHVGWQGFDTYCGFRESVGCSSRVRGRQPSDLSALSVVLRSRTRVAQCLHARDLLLDSGFMFGANVVSPSASVSICRPTRVQCSSDDSYVSLRVGTQLSAELDTDALENIARGIRSISSSTSASDATSTPSTGCVPKTSRWSTVRRNSWRFCDGSYRNPFAVWNFTT